MNQEEGIRRKRRLSRWWLLAVLPVVLAALGWEAYGLLGQNRIAEYVQKAKAAGQPTTWDELLGKPIPDDQNAAKLYESLARDPVVQAVMKRNPSLRTLAASRRFAGPQLRVDQEMLDDLLSDKGYRQEQASAVKEILSVYPSFLAVCRQASGLKQAQWTASIYLTSGVATPAYLPDPRAIGKLLDLAALDAHDRGDDETAMSLLLDQESLARAFDQHPVLVCHLNANAVRLQEIMTAEQIMPSLQANGRGQARLLLEKLLDDAGGQEALVNAALSDQVWIINLTASIRAQKNAALWDKLKMPLETSTHAEVLACIQQIILATKQVNYAATSRMLPQADQMQASLSPTPAPMLASSYSHWVGMHYRAMAMQRMAALAIAIRLYELDHGHRPASLTELVPTYLPKLPADPFNPGGGTFGYLPLTTPAVLYSFNDNMRDDAAQYVIFDGTSVDMGSPDLPYFLNGDRPTSPAAAGASSQPVTVPRTVVRRFLSTQGSSSQPSQKPYRITTRPVAASRESVQGSK